MRFSLSLLLTLTFAAFSTACDQVQEVISSASGGGSGSSGASGGSAGSDGSDGSGSGGGTTAEVGAKPAKAGGIIQVVQGGGPATGISLAQCGDLSDGGPVNGPDCVTAEIQCGETIVGHTRGGVNKYNTKFYERNTCWPGTRNHNGGDERVYMFVADKSPRFQAGEERQRVSVYFDTPCADLTFTWMQYDKVGECPPPDAGLKRCDSMNPFNRKRRENITVDRGEVFYFLVEGGDEAEGAFSISLECGT